MFRLFTDSVKYSLLLLVSIQSFAQKAYFIDGYHGGVYGHYPKGFTQFIVDKLHENPFWKINLEIEPETWDSVAVREASALKELQQLFADQSVNGRIEYVSPAYGQSYLYNISGESIIHQFSYGIKKVKAYFPGAVFTTYSSEEPCFTSALPQILASFGYKYACLKNPNTCWGGYTRAFGGELVNWVGPDGTKLMTVPRYSIERLLPTSTWQTEAWSNSFQYINAAFSEGIQHPVAMTLQDAGWKNGPFIGNGNGGYQPMEYKTWRDYFANASIKIPTQDWNFSQEDILVSLVWGSEVLQKLAQRVRVAEDKMVMAEKIAALKNIYNNVPWPGVAIDEAWRTLMLSQHHDCWIVPYNGKPGDTWADKVKIWTDNTNRIADSIIFNTYDESNVSNKTINVYNTTASNRNEWVKLSLHHQNIKGLTITDRSNKEVTSQVTTSGNEIYFKATVPGMGNSTYTLVNRRQPTPVKGATATILANGNVTMETDRYRIVIDKLKGGTIRSLVVKTMNGKEFVDANNERRFNELRGFFYNDGGFHSTIENPASLKITENGPAVVKVEIKGMLLSNPFTQILTLKQGERKIECQLKINWKNNIGIGDEYKQHGGLEARDYKKPFYNDSLKLLALFPVTFPAQQIFKDAPFDVAESKLDHTFFSTWDSIKNNILVSWVDAYDAKNNCGLALLTDHTTTYAHGENFPLGLNVQYSGAGLWGRNHTITGTTEISYVLVPHAGKWDEAHISNETVNWNEPLTPLFTPAKEVDKSLIDLTGTGLQVTTMLMDGKDLLVRLFNAEGNGLSKIIKVGGKADAATLIELNGAFKEQLKLQMIDRRSETSVAMPRFGLRTLRLKNFMAY